MDLNGFKLAFHAACFTLDTSKINSPGLQCSEFHGSNCQCLHSSPQRQKENCSREDHDQRQISSSAATYADSSEHTAILHVQEQNVFKG